MLVVAASWLVSVAEAAEGIAQSRAYVDGPWGQIHVRVCAPANSPNAPTVLLLHRMVSSSLQFRDLQPDLAKDGVRSIAVDIPGYGMSDGPADPPTTEQYAEALIPILMQFHLRRAYFMGSDSGATIVAAFAKAHPAQVGGLILRGPAIFDPQTLAKLIADDPHYITLEPDGSHFTKRWAFKASSPQKTDSASLEARTRSVMDFFLAGPNGWYGHNAIFRYDLAATLRTVQVPVLLVTSARDELYQAALQVKAMRPDFRFRELQLGEDSSADDAVAWANATAEFIKESSRK